MKYKPETWDEVQQGLDEHHRMSAWDASRRSIRQRRFRAKQHQGHVVVRKGGKAWCPYTGQKLAGIPVSNLRQVDFRGRVWSNKKQTVQGVHDGAKAE